MDEAFEGIEANDLTSRTPALEPHHAPPQIKDDKQGEHAKNCDDAYPSQRNAVKVLPVASLRVLDHVRFHVWDGPATLNHLELLKQLLLLDRISRGVDRIWLLGRDRS